MHDRVTGAYHWLQEANTCLPLTGGTMTGAITTDKGGVAPDVLGKQKRQAIQAFRVQVGANTPQTWIPFPTAFSSKPIVQAIVTLEDHTGYDRHPSILLQNGNDPYSDLATNAGFGVSVDTSGFGATTRPYVLHVIAIGDA